MKKAIKYCITLVITLVCVLASNIAVGASTGFSVTPVLPENQVPETTSFFDVVVVPGDQQELAISINNSRDTDITVELSLFSPGTASNGSINYTASGRADVSMAYSFEELALLTTPREVTVPANSRMIVPVIVDIPVAGFDGIILGSVHALLGITEEEIAEAGMIVNRFAFAIPVRLRGNDVPIAPDFALGEANIGTFNHRAAIIAEIRNPMPRLVMGASVSAQVLTAAGDAVFTVTNMPVDFAPNTIFPLTMQDAAGVGIPPGDYTIQVQVEHDGTVWDLGPETFNIAPAQAQQVNEAAVNQPHFAQHQAIAAGLTPDPAESNTLMFIIIGAAIALSVLAVTIVIIKSSKSKSKEIALLRQEMLRQQMQQIGTQAPENQP